MKARLIERGESVELLTPFDRDLVESLKQQIPSWARQWDPEAKCWIVDRLYEDTAARLIRRHFEVERLVPAERLIFAHRHPADCVQRLMLGNPHHVALYVLPDAPVGVIRGAYRALAAEHHPDRDGGSHERMVAINRAYEALKGRDSP